MILTLKRHCLSRKSTFKPPFLVNWLELNWIELNWSLRSGEFLARNWFMMRLFWKVLQPLYPPGIWIEAKDDQFEVPEVADPTMSLLYFKISFFKVQETVRFVGLQFNSIQFNSIQFNLLLIQPRSRGCITSKSTFFNLITQFEHSECI